MLYTRQVLEALEDQVLAPYSFRSKDSRGRAYPHEEASYRTCFQRDRDRILHTTPFRRLEYKTQVFVNFEGDYYRTRLTHTLEVAADRADVGARVGGQRGPGRSCLPGARPGPPAIRSRGRDDAEPTDGGSRRFRSQ